MSALDFCLDNCSALAGSVIDAARAELAALRAERDKYLEEVAIRRHDALKMEERVAKLEKACEAGDRLEGVASIVCSGCEELRAIVAPELIQSDNQLREVLELHDELKKYRAAREASRG